MHKDTLHREAVELYNKLDKEGWIQHALQSDRAQPLGNAHQDDGGYCLVGAVLATTGNFSTLHELPKLIQEKIRERSSPNRRFGPRLNVVEWNNNPERTKAEVLELVQEIVTETAPPPQEPVMEQELVNV